ncbi:FkbM family methyltransferase [Actinopolyspora saharensis]|uniref:FkbM family methyltransferase n=1 Tax=Actinopolyspora saharensis TaxID=995062 RepID=UPI000B83F65F|nr:FkbM family methyltransferase [Actinopolyspora saharensis]
MSDPLDHSESTRWPSPAPEGTDSPDELVDEPAWPVELPEESEQQVNGPERESTGPTPHGCTVARHGQLAGARVLRDSFLHNHPDGRFTILLLDFEEELDEALRAEVRTPADIGVDDVEFARLAAACGQESLNAVILPRLLAFLLRSESPLLYLSPGVRVFAPFGDALDVLSHAEPLGLVPRVLRPLPADGLRPGPKDLVRAGSFDTNLLAAHSGAEAVLEEWAAQARADPSSAEGLFEGLPAMVDHRVLRDPGIGLSVFNASQRRLETSHGRQLVDGEPLRSVHFEGFEAQRPWLLSTEYADRPRVLLSDFPELAGLCAGYRNALVSEGLPAERTHPFDHLPDGTLITPSMRAAYRARWLSGEQDGGDPLPSPFEQGDSERDPQAEFLEWAAEPEDERQRAAGCSRWAIAVWRDDPQLRRDYPEPLGKDAAAFGEWCAGVGVASGRIPPQSVRGHGPERSDMTDQLGVAVLGSGRLAELVRLAVRSSGVPSSDEPHYPVVLRCDPAVPVPAGHHLIDVRPDGGADPVDAGAAGGEPAEVWALSQAGRHAARHAGVQARVLALPFPENDPPGEEERKEARARLGFSEEFVFVAFADHADEYRANVLGLVTAFGATFGERADVRLFVAVSGATDHPEAAERLRLATATDPRVVLREEHDAAELGVAIADCVVSLHRAESGVGGDRYSLRLLDVVSRGIPVITVEHGSVAELLGSSGAVLVRCQGSGEPAPEAAAAALTEAVGDPEATARSGTAAREFLSRHHSAGRAGEQLRERVEAAYRNWRAKWARDQQDPEEDPLRPLLVARHALHRPPEVGMGGRNAVTPALRKAVLKALGHYDEHIRDIIRSLLDGVEKTAAELLRRQEGRADDLDVNAVRAELTQLSQRQEQLGSRVAGADDGAVQARSDLAEHDRRLRALEERGQAASENQLSELAERVDSLTGAVERTLDRVDRLEQRIENSERQQQEQLDSGLRRTALDIDNALRGTDALRRIVLREHERNGGTDHVPGTPVVCEAGLLRLPAEDTVMLPWLSSHHRWDTEVSALIDSLLEPGGVFLDIGAYVGYQTVRVLGRLNHTGRVVAVEPDPAARQLLEHNAEVNVAERVRERLTVLGEAAWDSDRELVGEPVDTGGVQLRDPADSAQRSGQESRSQEVELRGVRLDRELDSTHGIGERNLSVVHVDVGSGLHRVLTGLGGLLRDHRPSVVCSFTPAAVESIGDDPRAVLREFADWGYEIVLVGRNDPVSPEQLMQAIGASETSTVKLWLRPSAEAADDEG